MPIFQDNRELLQRLRWFRVVFILSFVCLVARLWSLSVLEFEHFKDLAERNRVRSIPELAPRGLIYDREGRVLVDNVQGFNLLLFRDEVKELKETVAFLGQALNLEEPQILERIESVGAYDSYQPLVVKEDLSMEEMAYLLSRQSEHPELRILKQPRRIYRYRGLAAHVTGYVGEISEDELALPEFVDNKAGDIVGQTGVERSHNRLLTGKDGRRRVLVDSRGRELEDLELIEPVRGERLTLTLDLDLQAAAETYLGENTGAVIAFDPRNGEVLTAASRPTFDPNHFAFRISPEQWNQLLENPDKPMQNRTVQSTFSPGSTFKIVLALAGLELGVIDPETRVRCNGAVRLYGHQFRCWKQGGHGSVNLAQAIQHSCNVFFYLLGQKLGIEEIAKASRRLGLGLPVGLGLAGEVPGLVPTPEWKKRVKGEPWFPGETISLAIGQGPLLVTPVQLARAVGIVATGKVVPLHLIKGEPSEIPQAAAFLKPNSFSPQNLKIIHDAMWSVVNDGGTGRSARVAHFDVCGKTGTAQTISAAAREKLEEAEAERFEPNSWFVGFAPRDNPEIVVVVVVERGGAGSTTAGPVAREIFQTYYKKHKSASPDGLEVASQEKQHERL